jgi:hypothetical protein
MKRILFAGAAAAAALAGSLALAAPAMASNGPASVKAVTQINGVEDTTSGTATSYTDPVYGPVWAYDNLSKQFVITKTGDNLYTVVETVHGSFTAFSSPNTGDPVNNTPINVTGSVDGTNTYYEYSTVAPDPANLPSQEPSSTHTGDMISSLFHGQNVDQPGSGNAWVFTYKAHGQTMTQTYLDPTGASWGNITG